MLFLLACSSPAPIPTSPTLVVALNWFPEPEFGGFYAADIQGFYKAAGLDVRIVPGGPGVPVLEFLESGKANIAITGADDLLLRRAKGSKGVAVFAAFQDSPVGLMTHDGGASSFEAITGKVAMEQGSPFQLFLTQKYGWQGKVELVPTSGGIGAFATDPSLTLQGYITSEPCQAQSRSIPTQFIPAKSAGWNPYASMVVVQEADLEQPWLKPFLEATTQGWEAYLKDPTPANTAISTLNINMPTAMIGCVTEAQKPYITGSTGAKLGSMTQERWNELASALTSVGQTVSAAGAFR